MKFNWGLGIALVYLSFMGLMIGAVLCSRQQDHSLVSDQYYADDLKYQEHYDKLANTGELDADLHIAFTADRSGLSFRFPEGMQNIQGEIYFFRPSDQSADFRVPLELGKGNHQVIPVAGLDPGLWRVKVDWASSGKAFYTEKALTL